MSDDSRLSLHLSTPKALGGTDGPGTNPEQLFAASYSACFIGALKVASMADKISLPDDLAVDAEVGIGPIPDDAYGFCVKLTVRSPNIDRSVLEGLVRKADHICPFSNAVRGNVEVQINVG